MAEDGKSENLNTPGENTTVPPHRPPPPTRINGQAQPASRSTEGASGTTGVRGLAAGTERSNSEGARRTHRAPPPPPQEPSTMVPKCTLGCPEHNPTCFPDSHWDALELQPFAQGYPLAFTRALTEHRSLMRHLNHLYIIVL